MRDNLDATVRRNKINSITASTLRTVTYLFSTGTLVQTLLATLGYGSALIYVSSTVLQAANVLSVILFARWTEGGGIIKRSAYVCLPIGLLLLLMPFLLGRLGKHRRVYIPSFDRSYAAGWLRTSKRV